MRGGSVGNYRYFFAKKIVLSSFVLIVLTTSSLMATSTTLMLRLFVPDFISVTLACKLFFLSDGYKIASTIIPHTVCPKIACIISPTFHWS